MTPFSLRDDQLRTIAHLQALKTDGHRRMVCVMPCGTGKSVVAAALTASEDRVVIYVPTVALIVQTYQVITSTHGRPGIPVLAVCDPRGVRNTGTGGEEDDITLAGAGIEATTDEDTLTAFLNQHPRVTVLSTYASAAVTGAAIRNAGTAWDAGVLDEGDCTAGIEGKAWSLPLDDTLVPIRTRYIFTATPRNIAVSDDDVDDNGVKVTVITMTDEARYGPIYTPLTWREAVEQKILSDYQVAVVAVSESEVLQLIDSKTPLITAGGRIDVATAAAQIALLRYATTHPHLNSVMAFCNRIASSKQWAQQWESLTAMLRPGVDRPPGAANCSHIDGTMTAQDREQGLNRLRTVGDDALQVVTNCRVFGRGVNIPSLDAVVLAEPRTSAPDIVQVVGRAMRRHPGDPTRKAIILLPVLVRDADKRQPTETIVARTDFFAAWQVLTTLAHEDSAMYGSLAQLRRSIDIPPPEKPSTEPADQPGTADGVISSADGRVHIDVTAFGAAVATAFTLRLVRRTTSTWTVLAGRLRNHIATGGDVHPRPSLETADGYPLGQRAAAIRDAYCAQRLHPAVIAHFEQSVPGWQWKKTPTRKTGRSFDAWCKLLDTHIRKTGVSTVRSYETTTGPDGERVALGAWLEQQRHSRISAAQSDQIAAALGTGWKAGTPTARDSSDATPQPAGSTDRPR